MWDGGNRFSAYQVAGMIRRKTVHVESAARRLFIRRAFTCYQMVSLLEDTPAIPTQPYLILDLLATFYDCLLYTSDAADERSSVDLGGRRIIKKKKQDK